jgi:uncharacterized membrane protein
VIFFWPFWWGYGLGSLIWNIAGIALFFIAFYLFFRHGIGFIRWHNSSDEPCEILRHRYASGEITKEEYEQKKKDLGC